MPIKPTPIMDAIQTVQGAVPHRGWLMVSPQWAANIWALRATGRARFNPETQMLEIEVEDAKIPYEGAKLEGHVAHTILGTGWGIKA